MGIVRSCRKCGKEIHASSPTKFCSAECSLFSRVVKADGDACWEFTGKPDPHGYAQVGFGFRANGSRIALKGHRVALEAAIGRPLLPDECALHTCDNRLCCRVGDGHIRIGTRSENIVECHAKGRGSKPPSRGQMLTVAQHEEIARRRASGEGAKEIAASMGISRHTVYQSRRRVRASAFQRAA